MVRGVGGVLIKRWVRVTESIFGTAVCDPRLYGGVRGRRLRGLLLLDFVRQRFIYLLSICVIYFLIRDNSAPDLLELAHQRH